MGSPTSSTHRSYKGLSRHDRSVYDKLPVDGNHFRLLSLNPGIGYGVLSGRLEEHKLSQHSAYDAISYHWGTSTTTESITINGVEVNISSTAAAALRSCRQIHDSTYLWVDQICINQQDDDERLAQVMLMGKIYHQATVVNIHLDQPGGGVGSLFELAREVEALRSQSWSISSWLIRRPTLNSSSQPLSLILGTDLELPVHAWRQLSRFNDSAQLLATTMASLLENLWFRRAWVIQEAVLAQNLNILCGRQQKVSWDIMLELVKLQTGIYKRKKQTITVLEGLKNMHAIDLQRSMTRPKEWRARVNTLLSNLRADLQYPTWLQAFSNMKTSLSEFSSAVNGNSLLGTMRRFRHLEASDGRDKIFGFVGMGQPGHMADFPFRPSADDEFQQGGSTAYTASISVVCFSFAFHQILITGTLDVIMASCCSAKAHDDLPFWVPDWSQEPPLCETEYGCPLGSWPHRAGADTVAVPQHIPREMALVLRGVLFDIVDAVIDEEDMLTIENYNDPTHEVWRKWEALAKEAYQSREDYHGEDNGHFDAFWRTLMYNTDARGRHASLADGKRFRDWLRGGDANDAASSNTTAVTGRFVFKNRKLYRTRRGYLGNGCSNVEPRDCVFVLRGGRLPFLLREERMVEGRTTGTSVNGYEGVEMAVQGYQIIGGDTYVHGICDGEVWERQGEELIERDIALI